MSIFKKIGGFLKKAAPIGLGIGGAMLGAPAIGSALGGLFSGGSSAKSYPVRSEGDPPPSTGFDWKGALQTAAPFVTGGLNMIGQSQANAANAKQAAQQMDFQREMSNTSYQRGTADMKAAGLNPMLAYSQGGASTPGGAQATMGNELGEGANSAVSAAQTMQQMQQSAAQTSQIKAQVGLTHAQTDTENARRLDILEGLPTHAVGRNYTEKGATKLGHEGAIQELQKLLLAETYKEQANQIISNAKQAEAGVENTRARTANEKADNPWLKARAGVAERGSGFINQGQDAIKKGQDWLSNNAGGYLYDLVDNISSAGSALRKYGKR